ncbi:DUF4199 domain-containing protein [Hymenobacter profundi]|uniref:DUF4199 domain-containing protein n=1 Tax=Hymenobacter profundi TaxID=1982110 RepID=A0ABS6X3V7_9BACT|nr:DUF4199 domain-containing protein [Hymenobacter profundi]MBW3130520.1 DUF4199 domain-containing protein [Hymenobacter profundi]
MENTSTSTVTTTNVGIRYGLLTGLIWIIVDVIMRATGLSFKYSIYLPVSLLVYIVGIVLAHRYFKQYNGGFMSFGQGVLITLVLALVSGLMAGIFNYIYLNFIDPDYVARARADMEAWMSTLPGVQEENIEKATANLNDEKMKSPTQILSTLGSNGVGGIIMGLIVSIFTKHKKPEFE